MGWKETASRVNNLRWLGLVKTVHTGLAVVVVVSSKWTATQHYPPQPQLCTTPAARAKTCLNTQNSGVILGPA